jgi:class 3 adenylate cyclase/tetratricopeptide (TPR) repeat protein
VAGHEQRRERKVVSVLFCDLVGFTQQAESLDPEDVEAILRPYHARVRSELERHGGTVEKFIGDAVMALFGAPTAHEDDPERAVRAALAIRDFALEEGLELRMGITTGEALVSLGARPAEGEGMASGDVVNTAARLQSAAPVNGILVDETTYRATRHVVDYGDTASIEAKGKSQPVSVWHATQVRSRPGVDVAHESRSELVGREQELGVLRDALGRVLSSRTSQLVTLVGVPGIGKSRLVYELRQIVDADPEIITWRQGRCLAYGEGVTLWALGEIVKAQAGIHEQDSPEVAAAKVRGAVEEAIPNPADVSWVESNLMALVGLGGESELGGDRRGEAFSAWRHFFEGMAEQRPLVLLVEDLHWADESLLDFVDELVEWVTDVPLLVVGTARPELLERRPGWGGGKLNTTTLALSPLTDEQTARLLGQLLERPVLAAESQQALLERAGGNPLYAEQFAELYRETGSADELRLPETLHGLIAARLDGLPVAEKELLRDAAVVGKVFWIGSLGRDPRSADALLHSLERKGFVRRQRRTSVEGESELAFAHALVRDVAYGQIARADRVEKHRQAATWIESLGRPEDHAEMLAHHWSSALELARAAGRDTGDLAEQTRLALRHAGDRALALSAFTAAVRYYDEALTLWPTGDPAYPDLLFRRARALFDFGDERREPALEEARDALLAAGDREAAGEAEALLAHVHWFRGGRAAVDEHLRRAQALVAATGASRAKARVLAISARVLMLDGEFEESIRLGQEGLEIAESLSLDELRAHTLNSIGSSKFGRDRSGEREMQESLAIARAANSPTAHSTLNNLGVQAWVRGDLQGSRPLYREAEELALRFGDLVQARFMRANGASTDVELGNWDEAEPVLAELLAEFERSSHYSESLVRRTRAHLRLARGDVDGAIEDTEMSLARGREIKDPQVLMQQLAAAGWLFALAGRIDEAREYAREALEYAQSRPNRFGRVTDLGCVADRLGLADQLRDVLASGVGSPWKSASLLELDCDFVAAARVYDELGARPRAAECRLAAAEGLIADGRRAEGEAELEKALEFFRSVGATFFVERGEALLAKIA